MGERELDLKQGLAPDSSTATCQLCGSEQIYFNEPVFFSIEWGYHCLPQRIHVKSDNEKEVRNLPKDTLTKLGPHNTPGITIL